MTQRRGRVEERIDERAVAGLEEYEAAHWGIKPNHVFELDDPDLPPVLVQMGFLQELHVHGGKGDALPGRRKLGFGKPSSVAYSKEGSHTHLFLVLPREELSDVVRMFGAPGRTAPRLPDVAARVGGHQVDHAYLDIPVVPIGVLTHVVYATHKKGDGPSTYIHEMGEDRGGVKPHLCSDKYGRLWLAGGSYVVEHRGIVN